MFFSEYRSGFFGMNEADGDIPLDKFVKYCQ